MDTEHRFSRRAILGWTAATPLIALAACTNSLSYSLTEVIRRLLTLSSQRAFARLLAPNGFLDDQMAMITLPDQLGGNIGSNILKALVLTGPIRDRLLRQVNRAAEKAADRAAPRIADAILAVPIIDAAAIVRGGPDAATAMLRDNLGQSLLAALVPGAEEGLRLFDNDVVQQVLQSTTGINFAGLASDVAQKANDSIFRAIGREEAAIRANPRDTNDPMLMAVFGVMK